MITVPLRFPRRALLVGLALAAPSRALVAHTGRAPEPHDLWSSWTFAPAVIGGLVVGAWWYARGVRRLWHAASPGRGIAHWRVVCFAGGIAALALALLSPIDAVATALFAVHMTQHMLLVVVAAPLLVAGEPGLATLWALDVPARRRIAAWWRGARIVPAVWHSLRLPLVAWTVLRKMLATVEGLFHSAQVVQRLNQQCGGAVGDGDHLLIDFVMGGSIGVTYGMPGGVGAATTDGVGAAITAGVATGVGAAERTEVRS